MRRLPLLLSLLFVSFVHSEITFAVEEPPFQTATPFHRHHRHRHSRDNTQKLSSPYRAAASSVTSADSVATEHFSLNCPHVADASNPDVKIEVTWTLDDTIWLKIRDGEKKVANLLTSFNKRMISDKTVMRATLNNRYFFTYDELTGDFSMEINPVVAEEDVGMWQCHVTVKHRSEIATLTSRSRVKGTQGEEANKPASPRPHYDKTHAPAVYKIPSAPQYPMESKQERYFPPARIEYDQPKISSFQRPNQDSVQISRDNQKRRQTVVFDRSVTTKQYPRLASIDYELSMADEEDMAAAHDRGVRPRTRAALLGASAHDHSAPMALVASIAAAALLVR